MAHFNQQQINQLKSRGISLQTVNKQLTLFQKDIKPVLLQKPATRRDGIEIFSEKEVKDYINIWKKGINKVSAIKFIPASGAASRMFKALFEARIDILNSRADQEVNLKNLPQIKQFFDELEKYPFYHDLNQACRDKGIDINKLREGGRYLELLELILDPTGLNYGNLAKGLLKFHWYGDHSRTPFEEHLIEAAAYLKNAKGQVDLHFTVSTEHKHLFQLLAEQLLNVYKKTGIADFIISFSEQDPSTDTLAVDMDNMPFLLEDGRLFFRPGGHGALLKNLEDVQQSMVFIGNIDNVAPDRLKPIRIKYKQLIGGLLLDRINIIHSFLKRLDQGLTNELKNEIIDFVKNYISPYKAHDLETSNKYDFIRSCQKLLNRPVRVCGMVVNTGEPGGGPFWVRNTNGEISKQIIESSQVDMENEEQKDIFNTSTHFNPVDLACYIKDYKGNKFRLQKFIDPDMAFIALKSQGGRELKTLELPGLWNGAMAGWITFFVEVPPATFSPVKTIFDLLRPEHL